MDNSSNFLSLPRFTHVFLIDTEEKLMIMADDFINYIRCEQNPVLGLDSEWNSPSASILQIAFDNLIYLVDMTSLGPNEYLKDFLDYIFISKKFLKLGCRFDEDLDYIINSMGDDNMCAGVHMPHNLVCVPKLVAKLVSVSQGQRGFPIEDWFYDPRNTRRIDQSGPSVSPAELAQLAHGFGSGIIRNQRSSGALGSLSLSSCCYHTLRKELDKGLRRSTWIILLLSPNQIHYAALDAYCELQIYEHCRAWANALQIDFNSLVAGLVEVVVKNPTLGLYEKVRRLSAIYNQE